MYLSNNNSTKNRAGLSLKSSRDGGHSWKDVQTIWSGPSAYSQLVKLSEGHLGVLFEAGKHSAYETISFAHLSV